MAWVIKELRLESLASSLVERAQDAAEAIRGEAERDARRARRAARREAVDASEYLAVLERLAAELHETVRTHRETVRSVGHDDPQAAPSMPTSAQPPAVTAAVAAAPEPVAPVVETVEEVPSQDALESPRVSGRPADRRRRGGRASLRTRAVAELFQPTEPVPVRS